MYFRLKVIGEGDDVDGAMLVLMRVGLELRVGVLLRLRVLLLMRVC